MGGNLQLSLCLLLLFLGNFLFSNNFRRTVCEHSCLLFNGSVVVTYMAAPHHYPCHSFKVCYSYTVGFRRHPYSNCPTKMLDRLILPLIVLKRPSPHILAKTVCYQCIFFLPFWQVTKNLKMTFLWFSGEIELSLCAWDLYSHIRFLRETF